MSFFYLYYDYNSLFRYLFVILFDKEYLLYSYYPSVLLMELSCSNDKLRIDNLSLKHQIKHLQNTISQMRSEIFLKDYNKAEKRTDIKEGGFVTRNILNGKNLRKSKSLMKKNKSLSNLLNSRNVENSNKKKGPETRKEKNSLRTKSLRNEKEEINKKIRNNIFNLNKENLKLKEDLEKELVIKKHNQYFTNSFLFLYRYFYFNLETV